MVWFKYIAKIEKYVLRIFIMDRFGTLKQGKSSTYLRGIKPQFTLSVLIIKSLSRFECTRKLCKVKLSYLFTLTLEIPSCSSSSSSLLQLMGKSKYGFMIVWNRKLTLILLDIGAPECNIALMEQGRDISN